MTKYARPLAAVSAFAFTVLFLATSSAGADGTAELKRLIGNNEDTHTSQIEQEDDSIIRLTPDRTKIIRLDQDAASVIVTNPAHASVMLDSPRLLIVMPRQPGATSFTVLNSAGETILERDIIVSTAKKKYIRVRKVCDGVNDPSCAADSYFYCPDGCYRVQSLPPATGAETVPPVMSAGFASEPDASGLEESATGITIPQPQDIEEQAPAPERMPEDVIDSAVEGEGVVE